MKRLVKLISTKYRRQYDYTYTFFYNKGFNQGDFCRKTLQAKAFDLFWINVCEYSIYFK